MTITAYNFKFKNYQVNNGLSENTVQTILQDNHGFMWFGTKDGLNRFDGNEFKIFRHEPGNPQSIGNNFVRTLFQDEDNKIWAGTDQQLYILDPVTEAFQKFNYQTKEGVSVTSAVTSIKAENQDKIWIGTMTQGVFCYIRSTNELVQYTQGNGSAFLGSNLVWRIYRDNAGTMWIGTRNGLSAYNKETNTFVTYGSRDEKSPIEDPEILAISEDSDGELWLGTWAGGLVRFNRTTNEFTNYFGKDNETYITHIRAIFEYQKNELLVGSDDGLYLFNKQTLEYSRVDDPGDPYSLRDQNVYSIYKDREEGIWIGTYFGGVHYISTNSKIIEHYYPQQHKNSLSGKAVSQFCEDPSGNLWIATEDGGLNYFNTKTKKFTSYLPDDDKNSISYHNIHALVLDHNRLWIGTFSRGLDLMDLNTGKFKNYQYNENDTNTINDNCIFSLYQSKAGTLFVGTPFGLSQYNPDKDNFTRIPEITGFVYDMIEDHLGNFWVACYAEGVFKRDRDTKKWINYRHDINDKTSLCFNKITDVYQDEQHRLWFSSEGGGICKYNYDTDDFLTIDQSKGLPNNVAYGVVDDNHGNIWVSTNKGISRMDPATLDIKTYTQEDGLQSNQFNYRSTFKASNGKFYFGGINGFNAFYPNDLKKNKYVPPVFITNFELLDKPASSKEDSCYNRTLHTTKQITLKHDQASFRISFVNLSFQARSKNRNAYILENLNNNWITTTGSQNQVSYINLAPGKYVFRIKGSNNDGLWNNEGDALVIEILPPLWKTNYAYALYVILFIVMVLSIARVYLKISHAKHEKKLEEFRVKKEKEMYLSKINFFTNIAHEIRTPLSLIKAPLDCIKAAGPAQPEVNENIRIIDKNADRLLNLVNQLLDFRKIEENSYTPNFEPVNFNTLITDVCYRFKAAASQKKINLRTNIPHEPLTFNADREALTKIISNLMSNALKFAHETIVIDLRKKDDFIEISVSDDGPGVEEKYRNRIFDPFFQIEGTNKDDKKYGTGIGLAFSRQLAEKHEGTIFLKDDPHQQGSVFIVRISTNLSKSKITVKSDSKSVTEKIIEKPDSSFSNANGKPNLLIVEDNEDLCNFLERNLKVEYSVHKASNGKEAMELLENENIDIIISDIVMPEVDGLELVQKTRENKQYSHLPIILLSARTNVETKIEGLDVGADSYIEKPFSVDYLKAQIHSLIRNRERLLEKFANSPFVPYGSIANNKKDEEFLNELNDEIEHNMTNADYSINHLANAMSMSRSNLQRKIKGISGMTPNDYIRVYKLKKAARLIIENEYRINEICYLVGFNNASYFSKCFHKQFGKLPSEFQRENINQ
jgi:signal transduction histidine kinase/ligand-binding sensor domain-containing protein/DNA-binding response OmpR family regulator